MVAGSSGAAARRSDWRGPQRGKLTRLPMAAFSRASRRSAPRKNPTCRHVDTPQRSKRVANAAFGPSGEVDNGPTASPLHRRGLSAAQQVSAMGPSTSRFAGPWSLLTWPRCVRSLGDAYLRPGPRDRRQQRGLGGGHTAAALARTSPRGRPAHICLHLATSTARKRPFPFVSSAVRAEGVPWGAGGASSTSAGHRRALVAVSANNEV